METEMRDSWALLIGIDQYPRFESRRQLGGCVNDVMILRDALVRRFGFQENRIMVLTNQHATRDGILTAFEDLLSQVGKNETVLVHYSGHGSQKPAGGETDEPDGWDETLVPYDSGRAPYPNRDITDDEIHDWLRRLAALTPYVTLIFDCCHSSTIFREGKARGLPREERLPADWMPAMRFRPIFRDAIPDSGTWLHANENCVLFKACGHSEFAHEILVGDPPQVSQGALTYFLVQELMSPAFKGATFLEVFERLRTGLKGRCKDQNPQLEGERNRVIFGQTTILPMPFVSVLARQDDQVTLGAGAACGLVRDSRWIVYAPGSRAINDVAVRLGTLSIVLVGATVSEAQVVTEVKPGAVISGAWSVEEFPKLIVDLVAPAGHPATEDVAINIARSTLLVRSYPGSPDDARISLQPGTGGETWVVTDGVGGGLWTPELLCREPGAPKTLVKNLEKLARLRMLASVTNPDSSLRGLVDFEIFLRKQDGCVPPFRDENGDMLFHEGDRLALEMRNRSSYPLYVYVLDIGLTGRIGMVYPPEESQELLGAGQTHRAGIREGEALTLYLPADFDRLPGTDRRDRETLKLIVSTSPAEFRPLFQAGQQYRFDWKEDWTTLEQAFRLLPRVSTSVP